MTFEFRAGIAKKDTIRDAECITPVRDLGCSIERDDGGSWSFTLEVYTALVYLFTRGERGKVGERAIGDDATGFGGVLRWAEGDDLWRRCFDLDPTRSDLVSRSRNSISRPEEELWLRLLDCLWQSSVRPLRLVSRFKLAPSAPSTLVGMLASNTIVSASSSSAPSCVKGIKGRRPPLYSLLEAKGESRAGLTVKRDHERWFASSLLSSK